MPIYEPSETIAALRVHLSNDGGVTASELIGDLDILAGYLQAVRDIATERVGGEVARVQQNVVLHRENETLTAISSALRGDVSRLFKQMEAVRNRNTDLERRMHELRNENEDYKLKFGTEQAPGDWLQSRDDESFTRGYNRGVGDKAMEHAQELSSVRTQHLAELRDQLLLQIVKHKRVQIKHTWHGQSFRIMDFLPNYVTFNHVENPDKMVIVGSNMISGQTHVFSAEQIDSYTVTE